MAQFPAALTQERWRGRTLVRSWGDTRSIFRPTDMATRKRCHFMTTWQCVPSASSFLLAVSLLGTARIRALDIPRSRKDRVIGWVRGKNWHQANQTRQLACRAKPVRSTSTLQVNERPWWIEITRFVVPTYALVATSMLLTAIDKAFIGRVSSLQLASLGPSTAVFDCTSYLLTFLNTATLSFLASNKDAAKHSKIRSHALFFTVGSGMLQALLLFTGALPAVSCLGASGDLLPYSTIYLRLRSLGAPVDRIASVSTQFWLAEKNSVIPMFATIVAAGFNVVGDFVLCPSYGVVGAAVATVMASAVSAVFLVVCLQRGSLWPSPFQWPSSSDLTPFIRFAGPVFFALLLKVILFAVMSAGATALGVMPAAAHQILVSIFFICGISFGQPLSWAAQSFLPSSSGQERRRIAKALIIVSSIFVMLSGVLAGLMGCCCLQWFSGDAAVLAHAQRAQQTVTIFVMLYVAFLTMEGFAIALNRLTPCLVVSALLAASGGLTIFLLRLCGLLSLTWLWASQATLLAVACIALGLIIKQR